jgi:hypothetical protein
MIKVGDVVEYIGTTFKYRPKYGIIVKVKDTSYGQEIEVYFPNESYVLIHSKFVKVLCK